MPRQKLSTPRKPRQKLSELPDATPRPGERAAEVVQTGILSGNMIRQGKDNYTIDQDLLNCIQPYLSRPGLRDITERLQPFVERRDRVLYIEHFLDEVKKNDRGRGGGERRDVRQLYREALCWGQRKLIPDEIAIGLVAVHLYYQNK